MEPAVKMEIFKMEDDFEDVGQATETETVTEIPVRLPDAVFVKYLTNFGSILLSKSQRTSAKMRKNTAAARISQMLRNDHGISITPRQILKKLHNLKSKLKKKRDICAENGSKLNLKPAENELLKLIDASRKMSCEDEDLTSASNMLKVSDVGNEYEDNANEVIIRPAKATKRSNGKKVLRASSTFKKNRNCSATSPLISAPSSLKKITSPLTSPQLHELPNNLETSETKDLSLEQLERMALLKQLKILDIQECLLQKQLILAEMRLEGLSK